MTKLPSPVCSMVARSVPWLERFLLLAVCWQLAGLFWAVFAPATDRVSLIVPRHRSGENIVSRDALLRWYDVGNKSIASVADDYTLIAVIAGKHGAAVVKGNDGVSLAARVGDEIQPGSRLVAVEPGGIAVEQAGIRRELMFPQADARANSRGVGKNGSVAKTFTVKPIKVTRGQMVSTMQNSNIGSWDKGMSSVAGGGIRLERVSLQPFAKLLRLDDGDILKRVNQRPLAQVADISLISYYFGQHTSVTIDLVRRGAAVTQHYDIQP